MIILGIDPALAKLGWGVISKNSSGYSYIASGLVKTSPEEQIHLRLAYITSEIENIINLYRPTAVAMEETFVNKNAISSLVLGYARGAVMSLIGKHQLPFHEFKPNTVKKTIVGVGHADKAQVQHMVKLLIKGAVSAKNFDESDALAIAFTCGQYRYTRLI